MATIQLGSIVADIRGKVGDEVYSRNQGGAYVRSQAVIVDDPTQRQLDQRAVLTALSQAWSATLTEPQRGSWRAYADRWPGRDAWGRNTYANGYTRFVRVNSYRYLETTAIGWTSAPAAGPIAPPRVEISAGAGTQLITIPMGPANYDPPGGPLSLYLFAGLPRAAGRQYINGPWRYVARQIYAAGWAEEPWTETYPWTISADQVASAYLIAQADTDGEISTRYAARCTVGA